MQGLLFKRSVRARKKDKPEPVSAEPPKKPAGRVFATPHRVFYDPEGEARERAHRKHDGMNRRHF